jgi:ABC-type nitrate/sulfonate/bicarbonate transport system substrate-binding protein
VRSLSQPVAATLALALVASPARERPARGPFPEPAPPGPPTLKVIACAGGFDLPIWAAEREGFFTREGVRVALSFTPSST